jgi:hypothetical protein
MSKVKRSVRTKVKSKKLEGRTRSILGSNEKNAFNLSLSLRGNRKKINFKFKFNSLVVHFNCIVTI